MAKRTGIEEVVRTWGKFLQYGFQISPLKMTPCLEPVPYSRLIEVSVRAGARKTEQGEGRGVSDRRFLDNHTQVARLLLYWCPLAERTRRN